jgi:hypothetical protein
VLRVIEHGGGAVLDLRAAAEHRDGVGDLAHDGEVVRDEHVRETELACSRASSRRICACTVTSRAETASSSTTSSGSTMRARAIATR